MACSKVVKNVPCRQRIFHFSYPAKSVPRNYVLDLNITIPLPEPVVEYVHRVMAAFALPFYLFTDLLDKVEEFVCQETIKYQDELSQEQIDAARDPSFNVDDVVKFWEKAFRAETVEYADVPETSDEEMFSAVYHKLVHSPALETILQAEQAFAESAKSAATKRTQEITRLAEKQNEAMALAVKDLGSSVTERDINDLAARHFEEHSLAAGRLNSEIEALHDIQKKEYRTWLMSVMEQRAVYPSPLPSPVASSLPDMGPLPPLSDNSQWPEQEESFTIHLGSQLKQMHNVRILAADVLDFCRIRPPVGGFEPRRLETALALYSTGLSGLVLLSDVGPVGGFSGLLSDFCQVCVETTELHFSSVEDQLQSMRTAIGDAVAWRSERSQSAAEPQGKRAVVSKNLQQGDAYITRHSNLSQVHVVFHMIIDDSVKSNDINSRHPVILGLRNILKTAACYDVTTLTLPLLLTHEMTEEMTVAWCSRRAELVFKCVKGFMMEAAGSGGAELHNLQFLVPRGISPELFSVLSTMLPSIFRVSNPLVLKGSSTPQTPRLTSKGN